MEVVQAGQVLNRAPSLRPFPSTSSSASSCFFASCRNDGRRQRIFNCYLHSTMSLCGSVFFPKHCNSSRHLAGVTWIHAGENSRGEAGCIRHFATAGSQAHLSPCQAVHHGPPGLREILPSSAYLSGNGLLAVPRSIAVSFLVIMEGLPEILN